MGMVLCDAMLRMSAALVMFQAKNQFQTGPTGRGKTVCMNDHTGLRDGHVPHGELEGSMAAVALATEPAVPAQAGTGVYAALDLGTNNCRLLIACPTHDGFRVVDSFSRIIRLGEGVSATGCISEAAIDRAIAALSICRDKINLRKARRLRLIATEACRAASNAEGFRNRVAAETGIELEVIDRETEASLAVLGCSPLVDPRGRGAILFDIGGGSTELVRIERDPQNPEPRIKAWMSIPLGVVTLAEQFGGRDVTPEIYAAMEREVANHVAPFAAEHGRDLTGMHLLGTSGTVTTLAGIHLNLVRYDRRRIDSIWMNDTDISATITKLLGMSYEDRANNGCISVERADLVLAGCAILDAIRHAFPLPRLRVADRGLREGMLVEMMREDGALRSW
ncbi:exopolyphosphatase / guanosine-5'-triphosphate,3'-diphosphate pyrophosphatase [Bradyrhizobium sp. Gha]|nr:exopolyphosphatase / guanosine-5'-triphosphate,3'-diphosphate pyrophosphatase [Bradyrhizobium sp. Gha]